jgi:alkanesulfonate monooxygenase SsuD/methylene tetrahydromethanopterin reductase-like flavin-dependent oxidoreductase (luciferase family)
MSQCLPTRSACTCIGLGEHHRADFAISSPEVLLGAIASRTRRIHLASSVTVHLVR